MATQFVGGYDPNTGYPSDDSTGVQWDDNVDLPGQFGRGGFRTNPRLAPPIGSPQGLTLGGPGGAGDMNVPDELIPPDNSTIPNMKSVGPFTGGSATDAIIRGAQKFLPKIIGRRIPLADLVTPTDELGGATGVELPRTLGRSPTGPGPISPARYGPPSYVPTPFTQPDHPSTMRYPGWPSGAAAAPTPMPARPITPTPTHSPVRVPAAAGPAAVAQQPNLGNYAPIYQPNIARTGNVRGGRSGDDNAPMMGAFDFSRLFAKPTPPQGGLY